MVRHMCEILTNDYVVNMLMSEDCISASSYLPPLLIFQVYTPRLMQKLY